MDKKNKSEELRKENIDETRDYFIEEIKEIELMSEEHKKVCRTLIYIERLLILASAVTGCVSISLLLL